MRFSRSGPAAALPLPPIPTPPSTKFSAAQGRCGVHGARTSLTTAQSVARVVPFSCAMRATLYPPPRFRTETSGNLETCGFACVRVLASHGDCGRRCNRCMAESSPGRWRGGCTDAKFRGPIRTRCACECAQPCILQPLQYRSTCPRTRARFRKRKRVHRHSSCRFHRIRLQD
jgi:hypothetical protein